MNEVKLGHHWEKDLKLNISATSGTRNLRSTQIKCFLCKQNYSILKIPWSGTRQYFFSGSANFLLRIYSIWTSECPSKLSYKKRTSLKHLAWYQVLLLPSALEIHCKENADSFSGLNCALAILNKCCEPSMGHFSTGGNESALLICFKDVLGTSKFEPAIWPFLRTISTK